MRMMGEAERRARLGFALRKALERRGMSERQLAGHLGVDPRKVARWREGKDEPTYSETLAIMETLKLREELFRNPPPVPEPAPYPIDDYLLENDDPIPAAGASG